jgi:hypothetical protein
VELCGVRAGRVHERGQGGAARTSSEKPPRNRAPTAGLRVGVTAGPGWPPAWRVPRRPELAAGAPSRGGSRGQNLGFGGAYTGCLRSWADEISINERLSS